MEQPAPKKPSKLRKIFTYLSILAIGIFLGFYFNQNNEAISQALEQHEGVGQQYKLINPLLQCDMSESKDLQTFEYLIKEQIDKNVSEKNILEAAVYFRDLDTGQWLGVNQDVNFSPASLLKVPLMIALYKQAEDNPDLLKKKIPYKESLQTEYNAVQVITNGKFVEKGKDYSIEELIEYMIVHSDNAAKDLIGQDPMFDVLIRHPYEELGIEIPGVRGLQDFMTVKQYATFFRILYNSSYLNRQMSNKALDLLSKTSFNQGLVAGLPKGMTVAHKFGERGYEGVRQLHDCGIVYLPKRPYLLCIMTRGYNDEKLQSTIASISKLVYDEVTAQAK